MFLGCIGRAKAQLGGDLRPGGRSAGALDGALDEVEHLLLTFGELGAFFGHRTSSGTGKASSACIFIQTGKF
jgi:hypothetical protein